MNSLNKSLVFWAFLVPALVACGGGGGSSANGSPSGIDPANLPDYWYVSAFEARQAVSGSSSADTNGQGWGYRPMVLLINL